MDPLEITEQQHRNGVVIALLHGRLDAESVPAFEQWCDMQFDGEAERIILDFSGLSYISSAGLRSVLSAAKMFKERCGLAICGLFGLVGQVFQVSGFEEILEVHHTVQEALQAGVPE